jgi:uncharacterized protein YdaU (DUF1376 family)
MATAKSTKSPAFQFYVRDFLGSSKVDGMSMTERGIYITLLARCWDENGLPTDIAKLAKMARMKPAQFDRIWLGGHLHECFTERAGRLHNDRLDEERRKQQAFRRRQTDKAVKRWDSSGNATASVRHASGNALLSSSSIASSKKEKEISDESPIVLTFPTSGTPDEWHLRESQVAKWTEAYPALNVTAECRKALVWVDANSLKTARGMPAFLVRWLGNATNHVRPAAAPRAGGVPLPQWAIDAKEGR